MNQKEDSKWLKNVKSAPITKKAHGRILDVTAGTISFTKHVAMTMHLTRIDGSHFQDLKNLQHQEFTTWWFFNSDQLGRIIYFNIWWNWFIYKYIVSVLSSEFLTSLGLFTYSENATSWHSYNKAQSYICNASFGIHDFVRISII